jgi:nicotinamide mononucleotide transporter
MVEQLRFEELSALFALIYLALAIRQSVWCWPAALISVSLWAAVDLDARLYMDFVLQIFYFAMAIYGWRQWLHGGPTHAGVAIHRWPARLHLVAVAGIGLAGAAFGFALAPTAAALPYLDSLTTVAAIVATFMVAHKVIENWIYWFAVDAVYVYVYHQRDLDWYVALYLVYLVMIVIGFREWRAQMSQSNSPTVRAGDVAG